MTAVSGVQHGQESCLAFLPFCEVRSTLISCMLFSLSK